MKFRGVAFWGLLIASQFAGCSKEQPTEPVDGGAGLGGIDPDQKALPIDSAIAEPEKAVTDVTLDGKGETITDGAQAIVPEPTPAVEELSKNIPSEPTPAMDAETPASRSTGGVGTGAQKRFIKAWELNIRSQPNRYSKIVGHLKGGDEVHVTIRGGWAKLDEGQWIRSRWLVKSAPQKFVGGPNEKLTPTPKKKAKRSKKAKKRRSRSTTEAKP